MHTHRHNTVSGVKSLLHAIAVVDVNINIEHTLVHFEELKNRQDNVVDIAEPTGLAFFRVVETACPVDGNIRLLHIELHSAADGASRGQLTKVEKAVEDWAILAHVEALQLFNVVVHVLWCNHLEELYVVVGVEFRHVALCRWLWSLWKNWCRMGRGVSPRAESREGPGARLLH